MTRTPLVAAIAPLAFTASSAWADEPPLPPLPAPITVLPTAGTALPPGTPVTSTVSFEVRGEAPPLTLSEVTGDVIGGRGGPSFTYRSLCKSPCMPRLDPGAHRLLLFGAGSPNHAYPVIIPPGPSTLRSTVALHQTARIAGIWVLVGGTLAGCGIEVASVVSSDDPSLGLLLLGPAVIVASLVGGLALIVTNPDEVRFEVLPGLLPAPPAPTALRVAPPETDARSTQGLTVRVHF